MYRHYLNLIISNKYFDNYKLSMILTKKNAIDLQRLRLSK